MIKEIIQWTTMRLLSIIVSFGIEWFCEKYFDEFGKLKKLLLFVRIDNLIWFILSCFLIVNAYEAIIYCALL